MAKIGRPRKHEGPTHGMYVSSIPDELLGQFKMACMVQGTSMVAQVKVLMQEYVGRNSTKTAILRRAKTIVEQ